MTTIRYFIPEDGDTEHCPNVFLAPKSRQNGAPPTLGQIKSAFPLPGRYHFRFKAPLVPGGDRDKHAVAVWMDCVDEREPIPVWKSSIIAKVTRVGVEDEEDDDEDDSDFGARVRDAAAPRAAPAPAPKVAEPMLDIFDGPAPSQHSSHSAPSSNNLLDVPNSAPNHSGSLLDMHAPSGGYPQQQAPSSAHDFLGMTSTPSPQGYPTSGATPGYPQQQRPPQQQQAPHSGNTFNNFSNQHGPFGGIGTPWK